MSGLYEIFLRHPRISTDSRRVESGSIFFALRGASFNGNSFAAAALAAGAVYAVVDDKALFAAGASEAAGAATASAGAVCGRMILVDDALTALQDLAREHRRALGGRGLRILAITGTNGKTTTKELVSRVLSEKFRVDATQGNLNNHIGVPLTLLAMTPRTELGVVEMGASACGEIAALASIAEPDYGLLTNIGRAHLEGFGGEDGVRRGKGELYDYLEAHGGRAFVCADDEVLVEMAAEREMLQVEPYPAALAEGIENHLEGAYNRFNIAAAVAVGRYFGVGDEQIRRAIGAYRPDNNRSQRLTTARNTLIVDCYNANPSSMQSAITNFLAEPPAPRQSRVMILGDMFELGRWAEAEHRRIISLAAEDPDVRIMLAGPNFAKAAATISTPAIAPSEIRLREDRISVYPTREELAAALRKYPINNALILIKGSRGVGLEQIIELL